MRYYLIDYSKQSKLERLNLEYNILGLLEPSYKYCFSPQRLNYICSCFASLLLGVQSWASKK